MHHTTSVFKASYRTSQIQLDSSITKLQHTAQTVNLAYDIFVGEPHNQPVLGRIVLVAILNDETFPRIVIRLALCEIDNTGQLSGISIQHSSCWRCLFSQLLDWYWHKQQNTYRIRSNTLTSPIIQT